jgi:hypothetical protein
VSQHKYFFKAYNKKIGTFCTCADSFTIFFFLFEEKIACSFLFGAGRNDLIAENTFRGPLVKIKTFLGPETATSKARAIWAQKSRDFQFTNVLC